MIGYDRRPAEAMKEKAEQDFTPPAWLFNGILLVFAIYIIIAYA